MIFTANLAARALTVAEALVGQLYIAILIGSLVGMALQARSADEGAGSPALADLDPSQAEACSTVE